MKLGQWIGFLVLAICLYILWEIRQVLLLVFAAVILATALNKLARRLHKSGVPRSGAVLLAIAIFFTTMIGFFLLIVPPLVVQYQELTTSKLPQVLQLLNQWRSQLKTLVSPHVMQYLPDPNSLTQQLQPLVNGVLNKSFVLFSNSLLTLLNLLLVLVLTSMFIAQPLSYRKAFVRLFPSFYRRRAEGILNQCEIALGRWIVGALISMCVVAFLSVLGLYVLGVPLALAQGVLAGLLNFVPNIGPTLSVVLPMAIALLDAPWKAGGVLILYIIIQQFESNFLTPYVMAQQVSLLPAITLLSQIFFATFFGFLGFLLAIPLTVVGQVWIKEALLKDILDRWAGDAEIEKSFRVTSASTTVYESDAIAGILPQETFTDSQKPNLDIDDASHPI